MALFPARGNIGGGHDGSILQHSLRTAALLSSLAMPGCCEFLRAPASATGNIAQNEPITAAGRIFRVTRAAATATTKSNEISVSVQELAKLQFQPGDKVLFNGGETYTGSAVISIAGGGDPERPVMITSDGGAATLMSGNQSALSIRNCGGLNISNLNFSGSGAMCNQASGIALIAEGPRLHRFSGITISGVHATGYGEAGISLTARDHGPGFADVIIRNVTSFDNGHAGIEVLGPWLSAPHYAHSEVRIEDCTLFGNAGNHLRKASGNGLVFGSVDGGSIRNCEAFANGATGDHPDYGPFGILLCLSRNIDVSGCFSHHNRTAGSHDGGGISADGGCLDVYIHDCRSAENDGFGFLAARYPEAPPTGRVRFRNNESRDDGAKTGGAAFGLWRRIDSCDISGNTVLYTKKSIGGRTAVQLLDWTGDSLTISGNKLRCEGSGEICSAPRSKNVILKGNQIEATDAAVSSVKETLRDTP